MANDRQGQDPKRKISVVLPVQNEAEHIATCLRGLHDALGDVDHEILICSDKDDEGTLPAIEAMTDRPPYIRLVDNDLGRGPSYAIRAGFAAAQGDVVVTMMADLSDPPELILPMAEKIRTEKQAVVSGSRYMPGGRQIGGPMLKKLLSRLAGLSLHTFAGLGTHDATTNFRAYDRSFLDRVRIESGPGFQIALELTVKAHLMGLPVSEMPATWRDRSAGESRFRLSAWLPGYLRWYGRALLAPLAVLLMLAAGLTLAWRELTHATPVWFWFGMFATLWLSLWPIGLLRWMRRRWVLSDSFWALAPGLLIWLLSVIR